MASTISISTSADCSCLSDELRKNLSSPNHKNSPPIANKELQDMLKKISDLGNSRSLKSIKTLLQLKFLKILSTD